MLDNVIEDIKGYYYRYQSYGLLKSIVFLVTTVEMYPVLLYRFGYWVNKRCRIPFLKQVLQVVYFILSKFCELFFHVFISPEHKIGPGLRLEHFGLIGVVAEIGRNCRISPHVIIGFQGGFQGGNSPKIGDNVYIGSGAKVLGPIKIGNNVIIGANSVVVKDIPDNAIAVGIPAKVIRIRGEEEIRDYQNRFH